MKSSANAGIYSPLSLLILDIDHFKKFNDKWGHLEGDQVLIKIAHVINSCLRYMDSAYRYGGEEFTIILPETELKRHVLWVKELEKPFPARFLLQHLEKKFP